ncbi:MAG: hypothetical protein IH597_09390 [Bacteroidales bacterium]|nr:hypothetical protein [Bacteroidales bacterium]
MKIVVLGSARKAMSAIEKIANDTYHYVNDADEALDAVERYYAELLVIENETNPVKLLLNELRQLPQTVKVIVLNPSRHYFMLADNTLNTSIHYYIVEKKIEINNKKKLNYRNSSDKI